MVRLYAVFVGKGGVSGEVDVCRAEGEGEGGVRMWMVLSPPLVITVLWCFDQETE